LPEKASNPEKGAGNVTDDLDGISTAQATIWAHEVFRLLDAVLLHSVVVGSWTKTVREQAKVVFTLLVAVRNRERYRRDC